MSICKEERKLTATVLSVAVRRENFAEQSSNRTISCFWIKTNE